MTKEVKITIVVIVSILVFIAGLMVIIPKYNVWAAEMRGRAEFSRAEQNKQILVIEAEAQLEVERLNAQMEVERARGVAEAMEIITEYINQPYLMWRFINMLQLTENQVIYIPTEGNMPILEAGRIGVR